MPNVFAKKKQKLLKSEAEKCSKLDSFFKNQLKCNSEVVAMSSTSKDSHSGNECEELEETVVTAPILDHIINRYQHTVYFP